MSSINVFILDCIRRHVVDHIVVIHVRSIENLQVDVIILWLGENLVMFMLL